MVYKRIFDILFSIFVIIIFLPLFLLIFFLILFSSGSPVFFIQTRSGINGKKIRLFKFRTFEKNEITFIGHFLRKFRIDELPQFVNVLFGDLSIVGPRPLYIEYNELYSKIQRRRLLMKPGITGLAQIRGLNSLSWQHKFKYDVFYVNNYSLTLDLYILYKTFFILLSLIFINNNEYKFDTKFKGNKK
jgi:lipopolysaccharide/colanic/teichoic acid biosynthesis glycosyltransferase